MGQVAEWLLNRFRMKIGRATGEIAELGRSMVTEIEDRSAVPTGDRCDASEMISSPIPGLRSQGLDVAAPGFEGLNVWPNKSHVRFLEVIHTASGNDPARGSVGLKDNFGHVDLYPNGGVVPQPGCPPPRKNDSLFSP